MRIYVMQLGGDRREVTIPSGSTIQAAAEQAAFGELTGLTPRLNGHPSVMHAELHEGDRVVFTPKVTGGI